MLSHSNPIFAVVDVRATLDFYRDVLGFENDWTWGTPADFGGIHLGKVHVTFSRQPELAGKVESHQHSFWCDSVDDLYADHVRRGAPIIDDLGNRPWGVREYTVRDLNGYHLRFGGPLKHEKPPTALAELPPHVRLEDRLPTWDEYALLHEGVNWGKPPASSSEVLRASFRGVVAIDARSNACVAAARAMKDARNWYSIWDVMVLPSHQNQRVGSTIMQRLLTQLKEDGGTGARVHLFTMSQPFYAKLGFGEASCTSVTL